MDTKEFILNQYKQYPKLELQDLLKGLYQSSFGYDFALSDLHESSNIVEYLSNDIIRLHFNPGLKKETLNKLSKLSKNPSGKKILDKNLNILINMLDELPFDKNTSIQFIKKWKDQGYPNLAHSQVFQDSYHPSYCLIKKKFLPYLEILKVLDTKEEYILAIDGKCTSGKTTFSKLLEEIYDCSIFHMDDFFLQPFQRTPERYKEPGGNVDRERVEQEILISLKHKEDVYYSKFNCYTMKLENKIHVPYKPKNIIEGSYSMHPSLQKYYTMSICVDIANDIQLERIKQRNPDKVDTFISKWIPLENAYFDAFNIKDTCEYIIKTDQF
jgi:uridine kinase